MVIRSDAPTTPKKSSSTKRTSFASLYKKPPTTPITLGGQQVGSKPAGHPFPELLRRPAAQQQSAPPPPAGIARPQQQRSFSGGGEGGGGGVATGSTTGQVATSAPSMPSDDDWWNTDAAYQAQLGGINSNKTSALSNLAAQRQNYDTDLMTTLKNLGRSGANISQWDAGQGLGDWDASNQSGAYGQGKTNLRNDFASRGMGDSSFYVTANDQFDNDMNSQFQNLVNARGAFGKARGQEEADANTQWANALAAAKAESIARRAAQYGV